MKRTVLFIVFSLFCSTGILLAYYTSFVLTPITHPSPYPRVPPVNRTSVTANYNGDEVALFFSAATGQATITLTNASTGIVYQATTNTDAAQDFHIDVSGLQSGNYTLTVEYNNVTRSGDFEL